MKTIILLTIFLLILVICLAKKEVNFVKFINCPEFKNRSVIYKNVVIARNIKGRSIALRFDVQFKKEVKRLMVTVALRKCENSENLDSCEYYTKDLRIKNVCDVIGQKNQLWSEALDNSNFPRSCPIPAGTYHVNNTKLEHSTQLTLMPIPIALWKVKFFTYDSENNNTLVSCADMDIKVYSTRN